MNITQYLALAIRLFAVFLLIYGLRQSSTIIEVIFNGSINGMTVSTVFVLIMSAIPIVVAYIMWKFPLTIAHTIVKPEMDQEVEALAQGDWLAVFLIAIGTYTFYYAITDTIYWLYFFHMQSYSSHESASFSLSQEDKFNFALTILELAMALALILKSKSLSKWMLKLSK